MATIVESDIEFTFINLNLNHHEDGFPLEISIGSRFFFRYYYYYSGVQEDTNRRMANSGNIGIGPLLPVEYIDNLGTAVVNH